MYMKINNQIRILLVSYALLFVLVRCVRPSAQEDEVDPELPSLIVLDKTQQQKAGIRTARIREDTLYQYVEASGQLDVPPQHIIIISAPLGGFLRRTPLLEGMYVKKGMVLAELEHPDYIQLQQDYLQSLSMLRVMEAEYKRQEELVREQIAAQKTWEKAKADYETISVEVKSLHAKLKMLGIDADKLPQDGIQPTIVIRSPINGYVTQVQVSTGKYVPAHHELFRIVDVTHLHAELYVFEKDLPAIKERQKVIFTLLNDTLKRYARVFLIGKELTPDRTVRIHCHMENDDQNLIPGLYIRAQIQTQSRKAWVVPESSIVRYGNDTFVIAATDSDTFRLFQVHIAQADKGLIELKVPPGFSTEWPVVTEGAYTVFSMMRNREEE